MSSTLPGNVVLYGFHRSTYVSVARLVLHAKGVPYRFHDVENDIYTAEHRKRHPFGRVPVLRHGDLWLYETSAIAMYVEEAFDGPRLLPDDAGQRARCHQWISSLNSYFYPYMIYHLVHERLVFPDLGITPDETVVAAALPKVELALRVMNDALRDSSHLVGETATLADYFLLPTLTALSLVAEGQERLAQSPNVTAWLARMGQLAPVVEFRGILPPRAPIEHARRWATEHRPGIRPTYTDKRESPWRRRLRIRRADRLLRVTQVRGHGRADAMEPRRHSDDPGTCRPVPFATALRFWLKLGFISFGGPAGQIAIMHRELVEKRQWLSEERFLHALNFCMLLPGPEAQQLATYIGWLKHGTLGGVVAGSLFVLPGFLLMVAISIAYASFRSWAPVEGVLFGLKAAVLAIVIEAVIRIARRALKGRFHWIVAAAAFIAIFVFGVPFPVIVLAAAVIGFVAQRSAPRLFDAPPVSAGPPPAPVRESIPRALRIVLTCGALWLTPILVLRASLGADHVLTLESFFFSKMAVVTFGGAYAALAYVAQEAVQTFGWLTADDMLQGLALAETTPGPLILVLTFVGFMAAYGDAAPFSPLWAGVLGATITTWVTFVPCFLWVLLGAPHVEGLRRRPALTAALAMVTAAVVGVILNLAVWFGLHALFRDVQTWHGYGMTIPAPSLNTLDVRALAIARVRPPSLAPLQDADASRAGNLRCSGSRGRRAVTLVAPRNGSRSRVVGLVRPRRNHHGNAQETLVTASDRNERCADTRSRCVRARGSRKHCPLAQTLGGTQSPT